jgi:membrane protein DedA with SNARE-associated domain
VEGYVKDLLAFISVHSAWAGPIMFVVSFGESMAFLSLLVPGTALLLAAGTLMPSGVLPLWPVLCWSIAGATLGDSVSYGVGKYCGPSLARRWPFTRHPDLLPYGIDFFKRYGGMSVFLGRFFGPLRAIIPLAAGLMQMPTGRFWVANVTSALVWGPSILFPGALLGMAVETTAAGQSSLSIVLGVLAVFGGVGIWFVKRYLQHS